MPPACVWPGVVPPWGRGKASVEEEEGGGAAVASPPRGRREVPVAAGPVPRRCRRTPLWRPWRLRGAGCGRICAKGQRRGPEGAKTGAGSTFGEHVGPGAVSVDRGPALRCPPLEGTVMYAAGWVAFLTGGIVWR